MHRMVYFEKYFNNIVVCLFFLSEKAMSFINYLYSRLLTIILTFFHLDCKVYAWFWKWFVTSVIWCHMHMHTTSCASSYLFMLFFGYKSCIPKKENHMMCIISRSMHTVRNDNHTKCYYNQNLSTSNTEWSIEFASLFYHLLFRFKT